MEREVGGGIRMGKTCKLKDVSFQCMTKFTTNKKKNKKINKTKQNKTKQKPKKKKKREMDKSFRPHKERNRMQFSREIGTEGLC